MFENVQFFSHLHLKYAKSAIMTPKKFILKNINMGSCSARDWDRIRITWGNPQSGCSDICSSTKRATIGVRAPYATRSKLRYEANQV